MAQSGGIDGATQAVQILGPAVKTLGLTWFRDCDATCGQTALHPFGEVPFHRPPEMAFYLEAEPFRRVMTCGDHQRSKGLALHHHPTAGRSGQGLLRQKRLKTNAPHSSRQGCRQLWGEKAAVVADHHGLARQLRGSGMGQFRRRCRRHRQQTLNGDVDPEDAAPAVGAKGDRRRLQGQGCRGHQTVLSW